MKYFIFAGERYYASGGGYDLICIKNDKKEAIEKANDIIGKIAIYDDDPEDRDTVKIEWSHVMSDMGELIHCTKIVPYGRAYQAVKAGMPEIVFER